MGNVIVNSAVSLDGFIADELAGVGPLFDYYTNGDVEITLGDPERIFRAIKGVSIRDVTIRYRASAWPGVGV